MAVLCPSCHLEPDGGVAGSPCPACGTKMLAYNEPRDELIGQVISDRFEIVARLGKGGMGTVYRARQKSIGREVALKMMDRDLEADAGSVKRFFREANLAGQLSHPNTVSVLEFGQNHDGRLFIAMELVRGRTLHDVVREEGALPVWRIVKIGAQICDALEAAHKLSIIHRDLKLENVMLLERDLVKVLDFGLARSLLDPTSRATMTGVIAGTPRYLPPEVAMNAAEPAPPQDLYALGVILGEIAVGHELWRASTIEGLLALKLDNKPRLDGCHPKLRALVERLLVVDPLARPGLTEVRTELATVEELKVPYIPDVPAPPALQATLHHDMPSNVRSKDLVDLGEVAKPPVEETQKNQVESISPPAPEDDKPHELETEWQEEKKAKLAAQRVHTPVPKRRPLLPAIAALVLLAGGGYAVWYVVSHHKPAPEGVVQAGLDAGTTNTVTITIHGDADSITIDGKPYGKSPLVLSEQRSKKTLTIVATFGVATVRREVVPDRDQVVQIDAP